VRDARLGRGSTYVRPLRCPGLHVLALSGLDRPAAGGGSGARRWTGSAPPRSSGLNPLAAGFRAFLCLRALYRQRRLRHVSLSLSLYRVGSGLPFWLCLSSFLVHIYSLSLLRTPNLGTRGGTSPTPFYRRPFAVSIFACALRRHLVRRGVGRSLVSFDRNRDQSLCGPGQPETGSRYGR
jgi:hypothetical protein